MGLEEELHCWQGELLWRLPKRLREASLLPEGLVEEAGEMLESEEEGEGEDKEDEEDKEESEEEEDEEEEEERDAEEDKVGESGGATAEVEERCMWRVANRETRAAAAEDEEVSDGLLGEAEAGVADWRFER